MNSLKFRQVHLDFHTSEAIRDIGKDFDKRQFQEMLKLGHVDSITMFSKCHHGWAYHPSTANEMHPHLTFDLLKAQIEAAHEIGVRTPIYLSAGVDEKEARRHPEWLIRSSMEETDREPDFSTPGYHRLCFNTPYLDLLIKQIKEVLLNYDGDGIFLDIVGVRECYCRHCVEEIKRRGGDAENHSDMNKLWEDTYANYTRRVRETIDEYRPNTPVFHNGGHIRRGRRDLAHMNSHLELESLPTGGWGYQHFPLSARYAQNLDMEYLGMTGKFHTTWGEFGGYKHPNALRFETALSIANGAKCSVGDQLHPKGQMDQATYSLIGKAYSEVEAKEAWCDQVESVADIAMLSTEAVLESSNRDNKSDAGCVKILLEGKYLFDVIDTQNDFSKYKVIVLPDVVRVKENLNVKLSAFVHGGGQLLATGTSGLYADRNEFAFDFGSQFNRISEFSPTYFKPYFDLKSLDNAAFVMYGQGYVTELSKGRELGEFQNPYFNRTAEAFSSHQHAPSTLEHASAGMLQGNDGIYVAWNVFSEYDKLGSLVYKEMIRHALDTLLGTNKTLRTNLPAQGIVTLMYQPAESRYIQHTVYASPVMRGMVKGAPIEVIEDILPLYNTEFAVRIDRVVKKAYLVPEMKEIDFKQRDGIVSYTIDRFECHQMVVLDV